MGQVNKVVHKSFYLQYIFMFLSLSVSLTVCCLFSCVCLFVVCLRVWLSVRNSISSTPFPRLCHPLFLLFLLLLSSSSFFSLQNEVSSWCGKPTEPKTLFWTQMKIHGERSNSIVARSVQNWYSTPTACLATRNSAKFT